MSSTDTVRESFKYFKAMETQDYYYKECAINARSPENEADDYEKAFILDLQKDPNLVEKTAVRTFDGKPYFVVLRKGRMLEAACVRCHSTPANAPADLVKQYGESGASTAASAISCPLSPSVCRSPRRMQGRRSIDMSSSKELQDVIAAFNTMSVNLRHGRDNLEENVRERTRELQSALDNVKTPRPAPFCASCKKIRSDNAYWSQIEVYVREHSEAEFSHGLCPDCATKLHAKYFPENE
jgi:hypothetical protein